MNPIRSINFSAGPAHLPQQILEIAQTELLNWANTGASVMETSHRSPEFIDLQAGCLQRLRKLMQIPDNYEILMLQGGARLQFAMLPMNILRPGAAANIVISGHWSQIAAKEANRLCEVNSINTVVEKNGLKSLRQEHDWSNEVNGEYLHFTPNETIDGINMQCPELDANIIADMSSCILSEPIDVSKYSLIYACAQKNMGPAGLTFVIIDKNLQLNDDSNMPSYLSYSQHIASNSMLNTPPTFPIYMANLMFDWLEQQGGTIGIAAKNNKKARLLYDYIDNSNFYHNSVDKSCRSIMNVPFSLKTPDKFDKKFVEQARSAGIVGIKGHRSIGGMRASLYNAIELHEVEALINFMDDFAKKQG